MVSEKITKVIIFDFDGVIVESNDIKNKAFEIIFKRYPEHFDDVMQFHRNHVSLSRFDKFEYLLEKLGKGGNAVLKNELLLAFSRNTLEQMRMVPFVKGAIEFLLEKSTDIPIYLASVTPADDLKKIISHLKLNSYFKKIYGCPPWNKPDAIRDIIAGEKCTPDEVVLIGDSAGDQRAAFETGISFIARDSGLAFDDPAPAVILGDLENLANYIKMN